MNPGAKAIFLTGMGADSDPSPRGSLLMARRHGLELAGAVQGVLSRPMQPVRGPFQLAYEELDAPLVDSPIRRAANSWRRTPPRRVRTSAFGHKPL